MPGTDRKIMPEKLQDEEGNDSNKRMYTSLFSDLISPASPLFLIASTSLQPPSHQRIQASTH